MIPPDLLLQSTEASFDADYTRIWGRNQGAYYTEGRFTFLAEPPTTGRVDLQTVARFAAVTGCDQAVWFFTACDGDREDPSADFFAVFLYVDALDTRLMMRRHVSIGDDYRVVGVGTFEPVEAREWLVGPLVTPWLWGPEALSAELLEGVLLRRGIRIGGLDKR